MQLKHATAIIVLLLLVASLSVAGCTSSSNINPLAADNLAGAINDRYKALSYRTINETLNYTVKTPFTMTKQDDKITYHGVIAEPPDQSTQHINTFNVTIVLTTSSSTAEDTYSNLKSTLKEKERKGGGLVGGIFIVTSGSEKDSEHPGTYEGVADRYRVAKFDPTKYGAVIASPYFRSSGVVPDKEIPLNSGDMSSYYEILTIESGTYSTSKS
jgi:hypothetical protein